MIKELSPHELNGMLNTQAVIVNDDTLKLCLNELVLTITRESGTIKIAASYPTLSPLLKSSFEQMGNEVKWDDSCHLEFQAGVPDRPLAVFLKETLQLLPNQEIFFYLTIPMTLKLCLNGTLFAEYPTSILSKTWLGEPAAGVNAYALNTLVKHNPPPPEYNKFKAVTKLTVVNHSAKILPLTKLILQMKDYAIFRNRKQPLLRLSDTTCVVTADKPPVLTSSQPASSQSSYELLQAKQNTGTMWLPFK